MTVIPIRTRRDVLLDAWKDLARSISEVGAERVTVSRKALAWLGEIIEGDEEQEATPSLRPAAAHPAKVDKEPTPGRAGGPAAAADLSDEKETTGAGRLPLAGRTPSPKEVRV